MGLYKHRVYILYILETFNNMQGSSRTYLYNKSSIVTNVCSHDFHAN